MIFNYISNNDVLYVDDYQDTNVKLNMFKNIKFRTNNSNYLNFQTQLGINNDNKIISTSNKQLSYLVQKYEHFLGEEYANELKKNYELLKNTRSDEVIIIEDEVFQFFDYESVSSTGHSYDLIFYLLYYYCEFNLKCKLLVLESNNKYYNSLLELIEKYYNIEFIFIKENKSYLFKKFICIKTYQNVLFNNVKTFINNTLIQKIIDNYDNQNFKYYNNIIKIKYQNKNSRINRSFYKNEELELFIEKNNYYDLNNIDDNEELKIYYLNKAKNIIIDWGSSYYININYYLLNSQCKNICVIFHKDIMSERNNLHESDNIIYQHLSRHYFPGVQTDMNYYSNFTCRGKIIDNISDVNQLLTRIDCI
jgi:hypothetical protein